MDESRMRELLEQTKAGKISVEAALAQLTELPFTDVGYALVDHHRQLRTGIPEVVFGEGKTAEQIAGIVEALISAKQNVLVTRLTQAKADALASLGVSLEYNPRARTGKLMSHPPSKRPHGFVAIVAAGTSDLPVAEEARETLELCGVEVKLFVDVGVAGLHRLLAKLSELRLARALIVVAGMEGALPSVVGGLVRAPVVAVPTSIGYGAARDGMTALFGMLTSCASGISVVNIDNGFGAAMAVARMLLAPGAEADD
jgi:NCAIR mutase (PurE)-related protein